VPITQPDLERLRTRARWAQLALAVVVVVDLVAVVADAAEYRMLGREYTIAEGEANDERQIVIGAIQFFALVAAAIFFIRWFKRAYENIQLAGRGGRFSPRWAIWGWFVPILFLWRPKQIANDLWRANSPSLSTPVPPLLTLWWAAYLISNYAGQIAGRLAWGSETVEELRRTSATYIFADSIDVIGALLAILVVRAITARQLEDFAQRPPAPESAAHSQISA
jgi:hypothetical protein